MDQVLAEALIDAPRPAARIKAERAARQKRGAPPPGRAPRRAKRGAHTDPAKRKQYDELGANWQAYDRTGFGGGATDWGGFGGAPGGVRWQTRRVNLEDLGGFGGGAGGGAAGDVGGFSDFFRAFFAGGGSGVGGAGGGGIDLGGQPRAAGRSTPPLRRAALAPERALTLAEALLGAEVPVPTLTGTVKLRVRPNTQNGQEIHVAGKGRPKRGRSASGTAAGAPDRGDLIVRTRVVLPTLDEGARHAIGEALGRPPQPHPPPDRGGERGPPA